MMLKNLKIVELLDVNTPWGKPSDLEISKNNLHNL